MRKSALTPEAVLLLPMVLLKSESKPVAVLLPPVSLLKSASAPMAVLNQPLLLPRRTGRAGRPHESISSSSPIAPLRAHCLV